MGRKVCLGMITIFVISLIPNTTAIQVKPDDSIVVVPHQNQVCPSGQTLDLSMSVNETLDGSAVSIVVSEGNSLDAIQLFTSMSCKRNINLSLYNNSNGLLLSSNQLIVKPSTLGGEAIHSQSGFDTIQTLYVDTSSLMLDVHYSMYGTFSLNGTSGIVSGHLEDSHRRVIQFSTSPTTKKLIGSVYTHCYPISDCTNKSQLTNPPGPSDDHFFSPDSQRFDLIKKYDLVRVHVIDLGVDRGNWVTGNQTSMGMARMEVALDSANQFLRHQLGLTMSVVKYTSSADLNVNSGLNNSTVNSDDLIDCINGNFHEAFQDQFFNQSVGWNKSRLMGGVDLALFISHDPYMQDNGCSAPINNFIGRIVYVSESNANGLRTQYEIGQTIAHEIVHSFGPSHIYLSSPTGKYCGKSSITDGCVTPGLMLDHTLPTPFQFPIWITNHTRNNLNSSNYYGLEDLKFERFEFSGWVSGVGGQVAIELYSDLINKHNSKGTGNLEYWMQYVSVYNSQATDYDFITTMELDYSYVLPLFFKRASLSLEQHCSSLPNAPCYGIYVQQSYIYSIFSQSPMLWERFSSNNTSGMIERSCEIKNECTFAMRIAHNIYDPVNHLATYEYDDVRWASQNSSQSVVISITIEPAVNVSLTPNIEYYTLALNW